MNVIKIGIVDPNHETIMSSLCSEKDFNIVSYAENYSSFFSRICITLPEILVIEQGLLKESIKQLNMLDTELRIVTYATHFKNDDDIIEIFSTGIKCFACIHHGTDELSRAIRIAHAGGMYIIERYGKIIQQFLNDQQAPFFRIENLLNEFEMRIVKAIYRGWSSTKIGAMLNKSPRTIEEHREKIYKKLSVKNKHELITQVLTNIS